MRNNKIGTLFFVSMLALAGIGVSFAGLTDTITVFGTVSTARVQFENLEYTGTWVYKIHGLEEFNETYGYEIYVDKDDIGQDAVEDLYPNNNVELISWAESSPGTGEYDVDVDYYNLMPGIDYVADLHFNIGTIPVIVNKLEYSYDADSEIKDLVTNGDIWASMYTDTGKTVEDGTQIHPNERVSLELYIEIPQNNDYQGKSGSFTFEMGIVQWTDPCDEPPGTPDGQIRVIKETDPEDSQGEFDFVFTVVDPEGVETEYTLSDGESFILTDFELGTYTITETNLPEGWALQVDGIDIFGDGDLTNPVTVNENDRKVTFDLVEDDDGFDVTVTFTNEEVDEKPDTLVLPEWMDVTIEHGGIPEAYWRVTIDILPDNTADVYSHPINVNSQLRGWCVDENNQISEGNQNMTVVIPWEDRETVQPGNDYAPAGITDWDCVDYIINLHRVNQYSRMSVQDAIWYYVNGGNYPTDSTAQDIIADVTDNASAWVADGRPIFDGLDYLWLAVLVDPGCGQQLTIIEVDP
jgi:hypothetical protein